MAEGDYNQAVENYSQAIRLRLDNPQPWFGRGKALTAAGRFRDAIEDFDQAIHLRPDFIAAYLERGFSYGQAGDFVRGIEDLDLVIRSEPSNLRAWTLRGDAQARLGHFDKAIENFSAALALMPANTPTEIGGIVRLRLNRSHLYTLLGKHQAALDDRNEAVRLAPKDPEVYLARGGSYHEVGLHALGLADRTEAIRLKPDYAEAWFARGSSYFLLGDYGKASQDLNEALRLKPDYPEAREIFNQALTEFAKDALGLRPGTSTMARNEGAPGEPRIPPRTTEPGVKVLANQNAPSQPVVPSNSSSPEASMGSAPIDVIRAVISAVLPSTSTPQQEVVPTQPVHESAEELAKAGNLSIVRPATPAAPEPQQIAKMSSSASSPAPSKAATATKPTAQALGTIISRTADLHNQRGRNLIFQQRKYREAIDEFNLALHDRPNFPQALNGRGFAYMLVLDWAHAMEDFDAALRLDPNYAAGYYSRAAARKATGDAAGAAADSARYQELTRKN